MAKLPERENTTHALIDKAHESTPDPFRPHMGASLAGHHCDRYLWLSFRWAFKEKFSGRMLRLFRRGQLEESLFAQDLESAGIIVTTTDDNGMQFRVDFGCHISGSMDGIIESGVPEAPKTRHVVEMKTHNDKSFKDLKAKGVEKAKPQHYAQIQLYMLGTGVDRALYLAVNKNDDELYSERVRFDGDYANKLLERLKRIVTLDRIAEPCSGASLEWYLCKFCPAYDMCHRNATTVQHNCRTCAHSTAKADGTWHCARWNDAIPTVHQRTGCDSHVIHPDLIPSWTLVGGDEINAEYECKGQRIINGEGGVKSMEIMRWELD